MDIKKKLKRVQNILEKHSPFVLLFSGGTDSSLLATIASIASIPVKALLISGEHLTLHEIERARSFAKTRGIPFIEIPFNMLKLPEIENNLPTRCYACKKKIISLAKKKSKGEKLVDGSHMGDIEGFRPGIKALKEEGIISPWIEAECNREDIIKLAHLFDLPHYPSRSCLLTRFPYNFHISPHLLTKIRKMEDMLFSLGIEDFRVRRLPTEYIIQIGERDGETFNAIKEELLHNFRKMGVQERISWFLTAKTSGFFDKGETKGGGDE